MRLLSNPWIVAQIDEVVAPYVGRLPSRDLAWMREQLALTLASDETAARLLQGARPREADQSGEVECESATPPRAPPRAQPRPLKSPKAG